MQPCVTRRLLLADISQSSGGSIPFPRAAHRVSLTEVVRCSRRIIAGAMAFQGFEGVPRDRAAARRWYVQAAEAGHVGAWRNLAAMYALGQGGVAQCEATAHRLLRHADALAAAEDEGP